MVLPVHTYFPVPNLTWAATVVTAVLDPVMVTYKEDYLNG